MHTRHWITLGLVLAVLGPAAAFAGPAEDKAMASQIANEIYDSGRLKNFRLGVRYQDGVAVLLGNVTDKSQASAAMQVAKQIAGVDKVVNKLELSSPASEPSVSAANALHLQPVAPLQASVPSENGGMLLSIKAEATPDQAVQQASNKVLAKRLKRTSRAPKLERVKRQPKTASRPMPQRNGAYNNMPRPVAFSQQPNGAPVQSVGYGYGGAGPRPVGYNPGGSGATGVGYDNPSMPGYAWPSYAAPQNYSALTYPRQYSPTAWPYIGPFYPYPQVPLGWRKVALEWDDGWWFLDFSHHQHH